jgi:hypothetical protein
MKTAYIILLSIIFFAIFTSYDSIAQGDRSVSKYDLNLEVGFNYKFSDYLPGFSLNGVIYSPNNKFSFASRNVFLLKVEKILIDTINYSRSFQLSAFHTLNYLDVNYNFNQSKKHPFYVGLGVGWIYDGSKENVKLNRDYGYGVMSLTFSYKITWFFLDFRGDIPFDFNQDNSSVGPEKLFPITIGLSYRFLPKDKD